MVAGAWRSETDEKREECGPAPLVIPGETCAWMLRGQIVGITIVQSGKST